MSRLRKSALLAAFTTFTAISEGVIQIQNTGYKRTYISQDDWTTEAEYESMNIVHSGTFNAIEMLLSADMESPLECSAMSFSHDKTLFYYDSDAKICRLGTKAFGAAESKYPGDGLIPVHQLCKQT